MKALGCLWVSYWFLALAEYSGFLQSGTVDGIRRVELNKRLMLVSIHPLVNARKESKRLSYLQEDTLQ